MDNLYLVPLKALMAVATAKEENIQGTRVLALEQLRGLASRAYVSEHMASDAAFMEGLQSVIQVQALVEATVAIQLLTEMTRVLLECY
jgi:hypothetical protein